MLPSDHPAQTSYSGTEFNGDLSSLADGRYLFVLMDYDSLEDEAESAYLRWFSENRESEKIIWVGYGSDGPARFRFAGRDILFDSSAYMTFAAGCGFGLKEGTAYALTATVKDGKLGEENILLTKLGSNAPFMIRKLNGCADRMDELPGETPVDPATFRMFSALSITFMIGWAAFTVFMASNSSNPLRVYIRGGALIVGMALGLAIDYTYGRPVAVPDGRHAAAGKALVRSFLPGLGQWYMGRRVHAICMLALFILTIAVLAECIMMDDGQMRVACAWFAGCMTVQVILISMLETQRFCLQDGVGWFPMIYEWSDPWKECVLVPVVMPITSLVFPMVIIPGYAIYFLAIAAIATSYSLFWYATVKRPAGSEDLS